MALLAGLAAAPASAGERVYYEIFVRSFQDSGSDGIGDLKGVTSRLDYLKDLGIGGLWLMPIFKSPSYHGYDATDYRAITSDYGSTADLDALIQAAHARGIKILLDLAINHTSSRHPWFSDRPDWYVWRDRDPGWPGPSHWFQFGEQFYYAFFGPTMPDLNLTHPNLVSELQDTARSWLARGIDGFRLDAARYYVEGPQGEPDTPETHQWIRGFSSSLKASFPDTILAGEVWSGLDTIAPYIRSGKELDLAFDFPFSGGLLDSLKNGTAAGFSGALRQAVNLLPDPRSLAALAPFLTNHDMGRIASQLARQADADSRLKLAALALLSQPGTPFLYYGEEIGMTNGTGPGVSTARGDVGKRTPMQWERAGHHGFTQDSARPWAPFSSDDPALSVQDQLGRKSSLLETYRQLIELRSAHPALGALGALQVLPDPSPQCAAFIRSDAGGERILAVFNFGGAPADSLSLGGLPGDGAELLWGSATIRRKSRSGSRLEISGLPPGSGILLLL